MKAVRAVTLLLIGFLVGAACCAAFIRVRYETALRAIEMADPVPAQPAKSADRAWNRVAVQVQGADSGSANGLQTGFSPDPATQTAQNGIWATSSVLADAGDHLEIPTPSSPLAVLAGVFVLVAIGFGGVLILLQRSRGAFVEEVMLGIEKKKSEHERTALPNPLMIAQPVEFATKADVLAVKTEVEKSRMERETAFGVLSVRMDGIDAKEQRRTEKVHERIDAVGNRLANVEGEMRQVAQGVGKITTLLMTSAREGRAS